MTHNAKRSTTVKDFYFGLLSGAAFGIGFVAAGHPLDTIKTQMQTTSSTNAFTTFKNLMMKEGLIGLYKGGMTAMLGSTLYRSAQFAVFESVLTSFEASNTLQSEIPYSAGIKKATLASAVIASTCRSVLESPVEYLKVRSQARTKQPLLPGLAGLRQLYTGFTFQWIRTVGMKTCFFLGVDSARRHTDMVNSLPGRFLVAATSATVGYWLVWPAETLKNQFQSGTRTDFASIRHMGVRALYRGIGPGTVFVFIANGSAMVAMSWMHDLITYLGLRE